MREQIRRMPRPVWILFAAAFVNRMGSFVLPFFTLYLTARGEPPAVAGVALACYAGGSLLARFAGGLLADRIGRRHTITLAMAGAAVFTLLLWRSEALFAIYVCMFGLGILGDMVQPASSALVGDLLDEDLRVTGFTFWRIATNVGWAAGLSIGGVLADRSFDLMFIVDAATSAGFALVALTLLPHGTRTSRHEERDLPSARSAILADRGFLLFLAAITLGGLIYSQNIAALPLHLRDLGEPTTTYGFLQALNGLIVVTCEIGVISITRRFPRPVVLATGQLLVGIAFMSLTVARGVPALVAMVALWTLGEMTVSPVASAFVADRAPAHARGRYQSAYGASNGFAWIFAVMLGTLVYGWNPDALWIACGALGVIAAAVALRIGHHPAPGRPNVPLVDGPEASG